MPDESEASVRALLGSSLQTGAARAVLILGAFSFVGALVAYLLKP